MWKYCAAFVSLANEVLFSQTRIKYSCSLTYTKNLNFSRFSEYQRITQTMHTAYLEEKL